MIADHIETFDDIPDRAAFALSPSPTNGSI